MLLIAGRPHATKPLFVKGPIGQPDPAGRGVHGCPARTAPVTNDLGAPMGSVLLEECARELRLTWTDHDADGYCIYVQLDWPDGSTDRTDRTCPAGELEQQVLPKRAPKYTATLIAVNVEKPPN